MSDKKIIIKNCPAFDEGDCASPTEHIPYATACEHIEDCKLKQIVEKCKKEIRVYRNTLLPNDGTNALHFGRQSFAYDILNLLDVQEVE